MLDTSAIALPLETHLALFENAIIDSTVVRQVYRAQSFCRLISFTRESGDHAHKDFL
jgi:hypothetical protein